MRLHDRTKRRLMLTTFVGACLMPTLANVAWCLSLRLPSRCAATEQRIGRLLGLRAEIGHIEDPRPGMLRIANLSLKDPASSSTVLTCSSVEVIRHGTSVNVLIRGARVEKHQFDALCSAVLYAAEPRAADVLPAVNLSIEHLAFAGNPHGLLDIEV